MWAASKLDSPVVSDLQFGRTRIVSSCTLQSIAFAKADDCCLSHAVVPRSQAHYGSSHVGGLPFRDRAKWDKSVPFEARRLSRAHAKLNPRSSSEVGRQAWSVEWSSSGQLLKLLRPAELKKYRVADQRVARSTAAIRNLEAGLNALEAATGIDLDGDGDVGMTNAPKAAVLSSERLATRASSAHTCAGRRERSPKWPRGAWTELPAAERRPFPEDRIPGYSGFMTNRRDALGTAPFALGQPATETEKERLQYAADHIWRAHKGGASAPAPTPAPAELYMA